MVKYDQFQEKMKIVCENENPSKFLMEFLYCYDIPKATLIRTKIAQGISADEGIGIGNKMLFIYTSSKNLYTYYDYAQKNIIKNQTYRIIMLFNNSDILALDTKNNEWLSEDKRNLYRVCNFFYPLAGLERNTVAVKESVNIKIGKKFAQLYNELLMLNPNKENSLNDLLVDLVFCLLADSFNIIKTGSMYYLIDLYSENNGAGTSQIINNICKGIQSKNNSIPTYIKETLVQCDGYSNIHGKFDDMIFDKSTRDLLLKICNEDWGEVEPEVLGALIQTIAFPEEKSASYNYTSTANIYKVIGPLFMDDYYSKYELAKGEPELLKSLLIDLQKTKILDPDCGTGNFLMVSLRELRILEKHIKEELTLLGETFENKEYISGENFYGIEPMQVAAEITKIGLAFISLKYSGNTEKKLQVEDKNICCAFPLDVDWNKICSKENSIVYIIGNPRYLGARPLRKDPHLNESMNKVFKNEIEDGMKIGDMDLATGWMYLASKYIANTTGGFAFVTTNSLTQGVHVPILWPVLYKQGICISYAYTSFKWKNEGINNNAVTVVIIGCRDKNNPHSKTIYDNNKVYGAEDISPYLHKGNIIVKKEKTPICAWMPKMITGNMAVECAPGNEHTLLLEPNEKDEILYLYPEASKFLKRVIGSEEYVNSIERWCIWIDDDDYLEAQKIPLLDERIEKTRANRLMSATSKMYAKKPYQFREHIAPQKYTLVVPKVTSENRHYFQVGYVGREVIVTNNVFAIFDADPLMFGIISSKMHHIWACTVGGGLEKRPRYLKDLVYNSFPIPDLSEEQEQAIRNAAMNVIMERENYSEMTLAEMYNYATMPESLKYEHKILDEAVDLCYGKFYSDQERLDALFLLYKKIKEETI